jgi:sigma-54 dependent transcriptional regulator
VRAGDFRFSPQTGAAPVRAAEVVVAPSLAPAEPGAALVDALDAAMDGRCADLFHTVEGMLVKRAFTRCRDNQVQTARLLGITRNTLRTLLKRHGLLGDSAGEVEPACSLEA